MVRRLTKRINPAPARGRAGEADNGGAVATPVGRSDRPSWPNRAEVPATAQSAAAAARSWCSSDIGLGGTPFPDGRKHRWARSIETKWPPRCRSYRRSPRRSQWPQPGGRRGKSSNGVWRTRRAGAREGDLAVAALGPRSHQLVDEQASCWATAATRRMRRRRRSRRIVVQRPPDDDVAATCLKNVQ